MKSIRFALTICILVLGLATMITAGPFARIDRVVMVHHGDTKEMVTADPAESGVVNNLVEFAHQKDVIILVVKISTGDDAGHDVLVYTTRSEGFKVGNKIMVYSVRVNKRGLEYVPFYVPMKPRV